MTASAAVAAAAAVMATSALVFAPPAGATPPSPTLAVFAGTGTYGAPTPGPATSANLGTPTGVAADASGNVYLTDQANNEVDKVSAAGTLSVVAGNGSMGAPTPGPATSSRLKNPTGVAVDASGNLYIADEGNQRVEKVDTSGTLSVIAGTGSMGAPTPGTATSSQLRFPFAVAVDASGNVYIADEGNSVVEKVTPSGTLSLFAGTGSSGAPTAGPAASSQLDTPLGVAVDASGDVYIADTYNHEIEKVDTGGTLAVIAGTGTSGAAIAGPATSSHLTFPFGVGVDASGNVYIADSNNNHIEKVDTGGALSIIAGTGSSGVPTAGPALSSAIGQIQGLGVDPAGDVYTGDPNNRVVEKITSPNTPGAPTGVTATAGSGGASLSWAAPQSDGNSAITGYQYSADGGSTWTALTYTGSGPFSASITGLSNGSTYPIRIRAINGVGYGAASPVVSVTPAAPVATPTGTRPTTPTTPAPMSISPTPPGQVRVAASDTQLTVTFAPTVPAAGSHVIRYEVSVNGGRSWTAEPTSGTARLSMTITGLTDGVTYHVRVRAVTDQGTRIATATDVTASTPKPWYGDPIAHRAGETAVPRNPAAYHGPLAATTATGRARHGAFAVPISWTVGRHLGPHQAAMLTGDGLFRFDSAVITATGTRELRQLVVGLAGDRSITCEGYSDYGNKIAHQSALALLRAQAVCAALRSFGAKAVLHPVGYGATRPVLIGGTPADRAANRRVVISVDA
jgi:outer membrane protein OmpA-like peptidoglycan-associated protein/sugar lactone lactonase YvrE